MDKPTVSETGLRLLKKGQKGIVHAIFSRLGLIMLLFLIQLLFFVAGLFWFNSLLPQIFGGSTVISLLMVLYLINTRIDPTAKITWLIIIMLLPVFGSLLFLYTQLEIGHRAFKERFRQITEETRGKIKQDEAVLKKFREEAPGAAALSQYIKRSGCFPVYENTDVSYYPVGEDMFEEMLKQLEQAEHFIFSEYFIIDEGEMWGRVLEILSRKAKEGVDVRVMYDGTNEFVNLPHDYPKRLNALGIKCKMFAPLSPFVSTHYNYRDHRKILVIDGHTAFTGGINFADRYINRESPLGHWKDTAVMVNGDAARTFSLMFLQMWGIDEKKTDFKSFLSYPTFPQEDAEGYVIPYGDCPLDSDKVGEQVYIDLLNRAVRYVHVMTPYLILDGEMENAIKFAAERGVDVSLILPGVPDKKTPYALAKSHYASLIDSGVKIYEYVPGFVHAKSFVIDDREAVVGTINLDYRSLYHHFECATYLNGVRCIADIEKDFENSLKKCRRVTKDTIWENHRLLRPLGFLAKAVAPLL